MDILNATKIGFSHALHLYLFLPDIFINYYVGENNVDPDLGEIYRFYDGGFTGNVVISKLIEKKLNTPRFPCKADSVKQNYRQIECKKICFQRVASRVCNCTFGTPGSLFDAMSEKDSCTYAEHSKCVQFLNLEFVQTYPDECDVSCPLECDSVIYSITPQSMTYSPEKEMFKWWRERLEKVNPFIFTL